MKPAPNRIGGFEVVCYSPIDARHRFTDNTHHIVGGTFAAEIKGLAVCQAAGSSEFYLFGCDDEWNVVTDTWHPTLDDAKRQADFEYEGVRQTWTNVGEQVRSSGNFTRGT